jgi:hypothetical protein
MRHALLHTSEAFTRIELLVVLVLVAVFGGLLVFILAGPPISVSHGPRITCLNNLKQVGLAYRIWANDHHDRFPASESASHGGWSEVLTNANQGLLTWTNYAIMAEELGRASKLVACPSDERKTGTNFAANINLSYFVGLSAIDSQPFSLLGGDRNLCGGIKPDPNYGFSPEGGQGNDVAIQTNSQAGPICWSLKMHSRGNSDGGGNILLGDGSAQEVSTLSFRTNWQLFAGLTTNWPAGHVPSAPSIRVIFP